MFTSEMESMLAMLMLIPTMTGGPEGTEERLMWHTKKPCREMEINWRLYVLEWELAEVISFQNINYKCCGLIHIEYISSTPLWQKDHFSQYGVDGGARTPAAGLWSARPLMCLFLTKHTTWGWFGSCEGIDAFDWTAYFPAWNPIKDPWGIAYCCTHRLSRSWLMSSSRSGRRSPRRPSVVHHFDYEKDSVTSLISCSVACLVLTRVYFHRPRAHSHCKQQGVLSTNQIHCTAFVVLFHLLPYWPH